MTIHQEFGCGEDEVTAFVSLQRPLGRQQPSILDELPDFEDDDDDDANGAPPPPFPPMPSPIPLPSWVAAATEPMDCRDAVRARYSGAGRASQQSRATPTAASRAQRKARRASIGPDDKSRDTVRERAHIHRPCGARCRSGKVKQEPSSSVWWRLPPSSASTPRLSSFTSTLPLTGSLPRPRIAVGVGRPRILKDDVPVLLDAIQTAKVRADTARRRWRRERVRALKNSASSGGGEPCPIINRRAVFSGAISTDSPRHYPCQLYRRVRKPSRIRSLPPPRPCAALMNVIAGAVLVQDALEATIPRERAAVRIASRG